MKKFLLKLISFYQKYFSRLKERRCVFYPTCSDYTKQAIEKYGSVKGTSLGFRRIVRCHPWQKSHFDPVK